MLRPLIKPIATTVLTVLLLLGWSGQAFSFVTTGACVAPMAMEPPTNDGDADGDSSCKGLDVRCMGSLGCMLVLGFAHGGTHGLYDGRVGPDYMMSLRDLLGRTPEPELSPPILQA
jgi:hypothetical protein